MKHETSLNHPPIFHCTQFKTLATWGWIGIPKLVSQSHSKNEFFRKLNKQFLISLSHFNTAGLTSLIHFTHQQKIITLDIPKLVWLWTLHTCNNHNSQHIGCSISHCFQEKPWEHYGIRLSHQLSTIQHLLKGGNLIMEPHSTSSTELCNNIAKYSHNRSSNHNPSHRLPVPACNNLIPLS
jgi:hypothetical protein